MHASEEPWTPTIWAYARKTGYETWLIDGQRSGSYQNFMTSKEAALIDHYIGVNAGIDTDQAIAKRLNQLLREPGKRFVYVNKRGAHFPYASRYPADRFPKAQNAEQQHAYAVRYSTQEFMGTTLNGAPLGDALIIYTSDHGERFDGASPHCNAHPIPQEFSVPLVLFSGDSSLARSAAGAAAKLKNRASHRQIFATLLTAMGYDMHAAEAEYGPSLLSATPPKHYFQVRTDKVIVFDHFPFRSADPSD
jgi:glucan phosphoethanolaminetransferase (alkaline phosphatase superfamily)